MLAMPHGVGANLGAPASSRLGAVQSSNAFRRKNHVAT